MKIRILIGAAALLLFSAGANATILNVTATQGNLSASATFEAQGGDLVVTLSNIGGDVLVPADILTGVFWDVSGGLSLTSVSALLAGGSTVVFDPDGQPAGGVVGGEFAYAAGLSGAPRGAAYGISSSGLGLFGGATFPGANLEGPAGVNGMQYGLTSQTDNLATGNAAVTGGNALIQHAVVFRLTGLPQGFDPEAMIRNVNFQYGTALSEPNIPTPGSAVLALMGMGVMARRRRM